MANAPPKRSVGRPRVPGTEDRIKQAALEVLGQYGFSGLTLERVCRQAKVPKATFYRRWDTPSDVVSEAFNERFEDALLEDSGELEADLIQFAGKLAQLYSDPLLGPCMPFIVSESKVRPQLTEPMREAQSQRRLRNRTTLKAILDRRGTDIGLSAELTLNILNRLTSDLHIQERPIAPEEIAVIIKKLIAPV